MDDLVSIDGNNVFTTSLAIADGVEIEHKNVIELIRRYKDDINEVGTSTFQTRKFNTKGRQGELALLDESQATFLITLMKNSKKVVRFKKQLTKEFFKQRQIISNLIQQRNDPGWQNVRKDGKAIYQQKTEVIKEFVEYATQQGSKSAKKYYMAIGNMENKALFFFEQKYKNLREVLTIKQLMQVSTADNVIEKALKDGMDKGLPYKEVYQLARNRIVAYADIIGKSPVLGLTHNA